MKGKCENVTHQRATYECLQLHRVGKYEAVDSAERSPAPSNRNRKECDMECKISRELFH